MNFTNLKTAGRALLVAAIVGTGTMAAAAPAMAQGSGSLSFNFSVNSGNGSFSFGNGPWPRNFCMSNNELRRELRAEGFRDIEIYQSNRRTAFVEAEKGRWEYDLRVNKCNGNIVVLDRERIRRR
jgi:hypothetical protein